MIERHESVRRGEEGGSTRVLWFIVLGGPMAWLLDESIALVIEAGVCGGATRATPGYARPLLVIVALAAVVAAGAATMTARRSLRAAGDDAAAPRHEERARFMTVTGLLIGVLALFGIVLRLVASLMSPLCA